MRGTAPWQLPHENTYNQAQDLAGSRHKMQRYTWQFQDGNVIATSAVVGNESAGCSVGAW